MNGSGEATGQLPFPEKTTPEWRESMAMLLESNKKRYIFWAFSENH